MSKNHIIWAIEPFSDGRESLEKMAALLRNTVCDGNTTIEPVYVMKCEDSQEQSSGVDSASRLSMKHSAEKVMVQLLAGIDLPGIATPRVITLEDETLKRSPGVLDLVLYAKAVGAKLIAANTHARKGLSRLLLGSFAESLILSTDIPICILNPRMKIAASVSKVLFPTNFSGESRSIFPQVIELCRELKAELTIFHHLVEVPQLVSGLHPEFAYYNEDRKALLEMGSNWSKQAEQQGVKTCFEVEDKVGMTSERISEFADRNGFSAITMAPELGAFGAAVLGSITRKVMRSARVPIWVFHPSNIDEKDSVLATSNTKLQYTTVF